MAQLLKYLALVSETEQVLFSEVAIVAAALQKQITRDFGPAWDILATIDAFQNLEDVPLGYWPIIVRDDIGVAGAAGIHLDEDGQPFALVQWGDSWSLTASHEALEMLADPYGSYLVVGDSLKPDQDRVLYLLEVCDPSEDIAFSYRVNGIVVSNFYLPTFFDPVAATGVRYSFTGAITEPRQVLKGGYISWYDPISDHWFQQVRNSKGTPEFRDLGSLTITTGIRSAIDTLTPNTQQLGKTTKAAATKLTAAASVASGMKQASTSRADAWHTQIAALKDEFVR